MTRGLGYKKENYPFSSMGSAKTGAVVLLMFVLSLMASFLLGIYAVQSGLYQDSLELVYGSSTVNGNYQVGDTDVHFVESINGWSDVTGHYNSSGIWIKSGRSSEEMVETCRHEFLHEFVQENTRFDGEEELVEVLDSRVEVPECQNLMEKVEGEYPALVG